MHKNKTNDRFVRLGKQESGVGQKRQNTAAEADRAETARPDSLGVRKDSVQPENPERKAKSRSGQLEPESLGAGPVTQNRQEQKPPNRAGGGPPQKIAGSQVREHELSQGHHQENGARRYELGDEAQNKVEGEYHQPV